IVTSTLYLVLLVQRRGWDVVHEPTMLLQIPFLFCVGIFYGYLSAEARRANERADSAEVSEKAKTEVIATLSHDVRNNLGAIAGYAEIVVDEIASGPA